MNDNALKVMAAIIGALVIGVGTYITNTLVDLARDQSVLRKELEQRRGDIEDEIETYQKDLDHLEARFDRIVDKMMDLHPMQASAMAFQLSTNSQAQCRDDFDCPEGQICIDETCEDL
jgi:hypothetical protein